MEEAPTTSAPETTPGEQFAQRLSEQRQRAEAFVASHRDELSAAQSRLREQLQTLTQQVVGSQGNLVAAKQELEQRQEQIRRQTDELARDREEFESRSDAWRQTQQEANDRHQELLEQLRSERTDAEARRHQLDHDLQQAAQQRSEWERDQASREQEVQEIAFARHEQEVEQNHLAELRGQLEVRNAEINVLQVQLADDQTRTEIQRRKISEELRARKAAQQKDLQRQRAELESRDAGETGRLERQLRGVEQQRDILQSEFDSLTEQFQARSHEAVEQDRLVDELRDRLADFESRCQAQATDLESTRARQTELSGQIAEVRQREAEAVSQLDALRTRYEELLPELDSARLQIGQLEHDLSAAEQQAAALRDQVDAANAARAELETLHGETSECTAQLDAAREIENQLREQLATASARQTDLAGQLASQLEDAETRAATGAADADLQRRYEMAMDDIRELREETEQLQRDLEAAKASGGGSAPASGGSDDGPLDWEAQKAKILAALENESDDDPQAAKERLKIQDVVNKTQDILADKTAEIEELQRLLQDQSNNLGSVAVGAAALGEMLDQDEIICEERANLKQLQEQWEEKLRKAEIDLSVERAKIARERAELEEQMQSRSGSQDEDQAKSSGKPGGRWLARLGLKDDEK